MGSGTSKKGRPVSASELEGIGKKKQKKLSLLNGRSISFPTQLASLRNDPEENNEVFSTQLQGSLPNNHDSGLFISKTARLSEPITYNSTNSTLDSAQNDEVKDVNSEVGTALNDFIKPVPLPPKTDANNHAVNDPYSWTLMELYNALTAESWLRKPLLARTDYLLLLDCRCEDEYKMKHIITAKHHSCLYTEYGCLLSVAGQLKSFDMIVLYNDDNEQVSIALKSAEINFYSLNSEYQAFENKYPYLCTKDVISSQEQRNQLTMTWPSEIVEGKIYQGNAIHALSETIIKTLGITHIINVTLDFPNAFPDTVNYLRIQLDDKAEVDLLSWLFKTTQFISTALNTKSEPAVDANSVEDKPSKVLVHCHMGRSRSSTIVLGYLMEKNGWSLRDSCDWLKDCRQTVKPNLGFLNQLLQHEERLFGRKLSDFHDLPF